MPQKIYIPMDKKIREKWLNYYYENDLVVNNFVDKKRSRFSIENALIAKCVELDQLRESLEK